MKGIVFILLISICSCFSSVSAQTVSVGVDEIVQYILSCKKSNGGFGPENMQYADLAWTYPAVHTLNILGQEVSEPDSCYINGGKPWMEKASWKNGPWYWSLHQKANLYKIMHRSGPLEKDFHPQKIDSVQFQRRTNYTEFRDYVDGKFFDMSSLWYLIEAIYMMGGSVENKEFVRNYVLSRQSSEGGFTDMLGSLKTPESSRANIIVTYHAISILNKLGMAIQYKDKVISWIQACQGQEGGFRWNPDHNSPSNKSDVWYTWAAVKTLKLLDSRPQDIKSCIGWLNILQNSDGGFADRPGWKSRLYSTYYAVHALEMITGDASAGIWNKDISKDQYKKIPAGKYSIFQAHHKSPSGGIGMVDTAVSMGLNLIALKTTEKEVVQGRGVSHTVKRARQYAKNKDYAIEIIDSPENYAHRLKWFSGMPGNHVSNFMIPPDISVENREVYLSAYSAGLKGHDWGKFKKEVIQPMLEMGTLFYPELDYTMLNAYMVYDEGLNQNTGYNAIPAAHFGNYDWVRHFPYKERWLGQLPMVADGDAHGSIEEWMPYLNSFRNVYIAKNYHYEDYLDASLNGRSVCVIRMPHSDEIRYYGSPEAIDYLKERIQDWKWW